MLRCFAMMGLGALLLTACGDPQSAMQSSAGGGEFRFERFCSVPNLRPSLRHTFILIDQGALSQATSAEEFAARNAAVRDAVLAFADPIGAIQSGAADYRERISVFLLPHNGSAARLLFQGCVPALSPEELAESRRQGSAIADFFTGGVQQSLHNEAEAFRGRLVSAVTLAARDAPGEARPVSGALPSSRIVASLAASGRFVTAESGVPRIVLLANLASVDLGDAESREAARSLGFEQGGALGLDLGRSELHVLLVSGRRSALARDYAEAFFLAQHARLLSWGDSTPTALPAPPVEVRRFVGEAQYPAGPEAIQIRLATDRNANLVDSWLILRGSPDRATPLTGQQTCAEAEHCTLRSDQGGFAQAWSLAPGGDPEFNNNFPFGGVRDWEIVVDDGRLTGRAFDPAVRIGASDSIAVTGRAAEGAIF